MNFKLVFVIGLLSISQVGLASLKVYTTTTNVQSLVQSIAGSAAEVESLTKGSQDPHHVEAKPSFMLKLSRADLLVSVGLDLEIGWLPAALRGARNAAIMPGAKGSLVLGDFIKPLGIPTADVGRHQGDVHPAGNPHFMLDPVRVMALSDVVANKLSELAPEHSKAFKQRAMSFKQSLQAQHQRWQSQLSAYETKEVITYHKTLKYFLARYGLKSTAQIEPKPGVPPSPSHIVHLIQLIRAKELKLILVENHFPQTAAQRIKKDIPSLQVRTAPVAVASEPEIKDLSQLYQSLVKNLLGSGGPA